MANTYTQIYMHVIIAVKGRESMIRPEWQSLKIQSTKHIKEQYGCLPFAWQSGFGAFLYSKSFLPAVSNYIANQKEHHKERSFDDEMLEILKKAGIEYDERYILKGVTKPMSDT